MRGPRDGSATWRWVAVTAAALAVLVIVRLLFFTVRVGPKREPVKVTRTVAMDLLHAAETWRGEHPGGACPTLEELRAGRFVDAAAKLSDAWGNPFEVVCIRDRIEVRSFGPDGTRSADDIVVASAPQ